LKEEKMPGGDGTGPDGRGGWCTPLLRSGQISRPLGGFNRGGRALGFGGRGRGRMNMFYATGEPAWNRDSLPTEEASRTSLEGRLESLETELKETKELLKGLKLK
jgi:hypothetical protein